MLTLLSNKMPRLKEVLGCKMPVVALKNGIEGRLPNKKCLMVAGDYNYSF